MKKKSVTAATPDTYTSPLQTQAQDVSSQERTQGQQQLGTAQGTLGQASGMLTQFAPDASGSSPYYRALLNKKASANQTANESAISQTRNRGEAAGFGASNPLTFGAETALRNANAGRVANIPGEAYSESIQPTLQAAGQLAGIGGQEAGIGNSELGNASGYFNQASNMEDQRLNEFYKQQEEARKRKSGIWGSLAKIGLGATSLIPGVGPALSGVL